MNKEQMIKYVDLMNRYEPYKDTNSMPYYTEEELEFIKDTKNIILADKELKQLIIELDKVPVSDRLSMVNDFFKESVNTDVELSQEELLEKYVELLNRHELIDEQNMRVFFSEEEKALIKKVNQNSEIKEIVEQLESLSPMDREKKLKQFLNKGNNVNEEQEISKTFGIDIDKIEHKYLNNGIEVFSFYDPKLGRQVVLENKKDGSLVEQLKKIQQNNKKYQTSNSEQNANDILNDTNIELKMITLNEIKDHKQQLQNMNKQQEIKLNYLINNYSKLKIKGINLDNLIYMDENDNLIEVIYDAENDMIVTDAPKHASYDETEVANTTETQQTKEVYEDSNYLDEIDKEIEMQKEIVEPVKHDKPKVKTKVKKAGYINAFLLFLLTGFVGGVLATVITLIISR